MGDAGAVQSQLPTAAGLDPSSAFKKIPDQLKIRSACAGGLFQLLESYFLGRELRSGQALYEEQGFGFPGHASEFLAERLHTINCDPEQVGLRLGQRRDRAAHSMRFAVRSAFGPATYGCHVRWCLNKMYDHLQYLLCSTSSQYVDYECGNRPRRVVC